MIHFHSSNRYSCTMESRLIYGLGNSKSLFRSGDSIIDNVLRQGISHFDVAPLYGGGYAESLIGKFSKRNDITVTTKMGLNNWRTSSATSRYKPLSNKVIGKLLKKSVVPNYKIDFLKESMKASMERLGDSNTKGITFLLHEYLPVDDQNFTQLSAFLSEEKKAGSIMDYGVATSRMVTLTFLPKSLPILQSDFDSAFALSRKTEYQDNEFRAFGLFRGFNDLSLDERDKRIESGREFLQRNVRNRIVISTLSMKHLEFALRELNV